MKDTSRKQVVRKVMETPRPAGLYAVRNVQTGRLLFGATPDLDGMLNRQRFQLDMGSHPDKELQADWNQLGSDAFAFEILDRLDLKDVATVNLMEDLRVLKALWLERFEGRGAALYGWSLRGA